MEFDVRGILAILSIVLRAWNCHSATDCPQAFDAPICEDIKRKDCYNASIEDNCCNACSHWIFDISGCDFGDRRTDCENISRKNCYESDIQNDCCFTCYYLYNEKYPDCYYGDKEDFCFDIGIRDCANHTVASTCCQRCGFLLDNGCNEDISSTCSNTSSLCYDVNFKQVCCETCYNVYDEYLVRDTDCMYGDRAQNCGYLPRRECYNETMYKACCYHCYSNARNNELPNCLYGNRGNCYGIKPRDCYDTNIRDTCCETCDSWMNVLAADCIYGDHRPDCMLEKCAGYSIEDKSQCCQTCATFLPLSTTPRPYDTELSSSRQSVYTRTMSLINYFSTKIPTGTTQIQNLDSNRGAVTGSVVPAAVGGAIGGFIAVVLVMAVVYFIWKRGYCIKSFSGI